MENTIEQFNDIAYKLIVDLAEITDSSKIKMSKSVFITIVEENPSTPIEKFILNILPHKEHILSKDTEFFINYKFDEIEEKSVLKDILSLKSLWNNLTETDKDNVFEYLLQLCNASEYYLKLFLKKKEQVP